MKLKKLLAGVTAAALAVTTVAVTSFTASAAAKDPVEITLYDSSTAVSGLDCGSDGKIYSVSGANMSAWSVTEDNISDCSFKITYAAAPTAGVVGIYANGEDGNVDWNANLAYFSDLDGTTTAFSLSNIGDKAAAGAANGVTIQIKSSIITSVDFNDGTTDHNLYTYEGGVIENIDFTPAAMSALEGASGISAAFTGEGDGYGYFQETTSWACTDGGNPAVLTNEDDKWDTFMSASGIKINIGGFTSLSKVVLTITYPEESEDNGEFEISVDPGTKTIAVGEDFQITVLVIGTTEELQNVEGTMTATNSDDTVVELSNGTDTDDGMIYTATGLAAGNATLEFEWVPNNMELETPLKVSCKVTVTDGTTTPPAGDKTLEGSATITCDNYWGQKEVTLAELIGDLDPEKTTIVFTGEFLNKIGYNSVSQTPAADGSKWREIEAASGKITLDASDLVIDGFYFTIAAGKESGDTTVSWVATEKGEGSDEPDDPTPPVTGDALWEGNTDMGTAWSANVQISANKFADIKAGDTIKFTFTCKDNSQLKIMSLAENWPVLPGPNPDPEWGIINVSGTSFSFELTAADVTALKENGMVISGQNVTLTKVELVPKAEPKPPVDPDHTHTPATVWSSDAEGHWHACSGCDEKLDSAAHTSDSGTITTPATETTTGTRTYKCTICGYVIRTETIPATGSSNVPQYPSHNTGNDSVVIPINGVNNSRVPTVNGKNGWEAVSAEITVASDGDKIVVDMNTATKVPSTILGDIEGKDVDVVFNMGRGITWTINGLSVTNRKTIDLDITKNTRHIPDEVVDNAEGSHKRQISLDHKGTFGCTATLSYDVGTRYNGLYANLFYYNTKAKQLEFADCSLVSGGKAKFVFTHASDYLITISDEPLGEFEDVSSASGIVSDDGVIGNGVAVSAVLAVIVLCFGIVVYRKRRHN